MMVNADLNENHVTCIDQGDWRKFFIDYLKNHVAKKKDFKRRALKYLLLGEELYKKKKIVDRILLRCLNRHDSMLAMTKVFEGIYSAHQVGLKINGYCFDMIISGQL